MLWGILALFGGGSFVIGGFDVLSDPNCESISFGGGRAVSATCYPAGMGAIPGTIGGLGMLAFGLFLVVVGVRTFRR